MDYLSIVSSHSLPTDISHALHKHTHLLIQSIHPSAQKQEESNQIQFQIKVLQTNPEKYQLIIFHVRDERTITLVLFYSLVSTDCCPFGSCFDMNSSCGLLIVLVISSRDDIGFFVMGGPSSMKTGVSTRRKRVVKKDPRHTHFWTRLGPPRGEILFVQMPRVFQSLLPRHLSAMYGRDAAALSQWQRTWLLSMNSW